MKNSILKPKITRVVGSACAAFLLGGVLVTSCSDDLLTGQPSWLGESIYDELDRRGNFTETLKLINAQDEDYASVLKKTGSKTLFVADDAAWAEFYKNNPWGVTSVESMTNAQKKLLFKSNMINSAYLVELLGNIPSRTTESEPEEGTCMRRATSVDLMDSVPVVTSDKYPEINPARRDVNTGQQIDYWSRVRGKDKILMLQDDNVASMIHFMPKFMQVNNITSDDVAFLTNGEITSNEGAFVNGQPILEEGKDIVCQNGYIHQLAGVSVPLDNMANVVAAQPQFSIYSRLLDRFSYPHFDATLSAEYQRQYGGQDSVFVKRYFNESGNNPFAAMDDNTTVDRLLPYDPGWNRGTQSGSYQEDAMVMLVPTDDALMEYLEGDGADLKERYANAGSGETAWDNAPDNVVLPLLQNTMLKDHSSLKASIPSLFSGITNTASESMGVEKKDIEQVLWACNGIIYQTNKVYVAPDYVSVYYPCVIRGDDDLYYIYSYIEKDNSERVQNGNHPYTGEPVYVSVGKGFKSQLNNMGSKYSFIIPTNKALQTYYDPVSYKREDSRGNSTAVAYRFGVSTNGEIIATPIAVDWTALDDKGRAQFMEPYSTALTTAFRTGDVTNHFSDIVNSSFTPNLFVPGQKFYQAQNGGPIIVEWDGNTLKGVAGSFQYERGYFIPVEEMFDKSVDGNGRSYIIDDEPLMSTFTSPYAALTDSLRKEQFGSFASLLTSMDIVVSNDGTNHLTMDNALSNLNNYHYTIYVPTNASIDALTAAHRLPTWDDVDEVTEVISVIADKHDAVQNDETLTNEERTRKLAEISADSAFLVKQRVRMSTLINDFVNYHIQDNSVYVEGESHSNDVFETACLDTLTNRFVKVYVSYAPGGPLTVKDNTGHTRTVDNALNNVLTRQYYFASNTGGTITSMANATQIYSSSFAVLHQIDEPLVPFANFYYDPADYDHVQEIISRYPVNSDSDPSPNPIKRKR